MRKTLKLKELIINNFIKYFTSDEDDREALYEATYDYINEIDNDEIEDYLKINVDMNITTNKDIQRLFKKETGFSAKYTAKVEYITWLEDKLVQILK